ncbi:MAG TPA: HAMP domain-containing sensor histidine kinase [Gemmatimonadales bacterium]|nr:HAMP domain-containing sensor histidine kinase [Gemmatimonadales bacterium]
MTEAVSTTDRTAPAAPSDVPQGLSLEALARLDAARLAVVLLRPLAHDLRTLLQNVTLAAHGAAASGGSPSGQRLLGVLNHDTGRLAELVGSMQSLLRREGASPAFLSVADVIHEVVELQALAARDCVARVVASVVEPLPAVYAVAVQLRHALLNLVVNAKEALAEGGGSEVWLAAEPDGEGVRIAVEDDGPGIPAGRGAWIFEPYTTTKEGRGGCGLGLPVARHLLAVQGGELRVEPPVQLKGARFVVWLPARPAGARLSLA